jgi:hypothetical protein
MRTGPRPKGQYVKIKMTLRQARAVEAILRNQLGGASLLVLDKSDRRTLAAAEDRISDEVHKADVEYTARSERIWKAYREMEARQRAKEAEA